MRHPYADFIDRIQKPARYLGGEYRSVTKDFDQAFVTMALAFPDLYDIGMSHLGTKILYKVLNDDPRIAAERCFAPWPDLEAELRAHQVPLVSLENARPLKSFDVVGFSLQYELTYTNVLLMLELGGIPLRAADRRLEDPLIVAGGPTATHPEPIAPFFDAILVGDGEERAPQLVVRWKECRNAGMSREDALVELARLGGIYVPSLYSTRTDERTGFVVVDKPLRDGVPERVSRALVEDINRFPFPSDSPVPAAEAVFDRMGVEIARGCTEGCRFCQAGMIYRPVRERTPESIVKTVLDSVDGGGYDEVSLTALSTADVSCIAPLIEKVADELTARKVSMSVSSLRAYGLPGEVLDDISRVRASGLTFAPEAGTQRMRDVICKNITEEDMSATSHRVFSRGWSKAKLYFMIGLPTEEDSDVMGIIATGKMVRDIALQYHRKTRVDVTVSVSSHVPKPHTPFQWAALDTMAELSRKQSLLRSEARTAKVTLKTHDSEGSWLEGILGRGDRRLADVIEAAYRNGCRFDGWGEHLRFEVWRQAIQASGLDPQIFLGTIPVDAALPWDHIDVGLAPDFLAKEYRKSLKGRLSPPCGKPFQAQVHHTNLEDANADHRRLVCYDCGVACDLDRMREERIEFLQILGAKAPRTKAPEVERPSRGDGNKHERPVPPTRPEQGEARRYRLRFRKVGRAVYQGHLDVVRALPRILRRAGLTLHYSQGFHPHPLLSFSPALGLGCPSLAEYADVTIAEEVTPVEFLARLAKVTPGGLEFTAVRRLRVGDPSLAEAITMADWLAVYPAGTELQADGIKNVVTVERKGKSREVKLADVVMAIEPSQLSSWPDNLDLPEGTPVRLRLRVDGGIKPSEAAAALAVGAVAPRAIARLALLADDGSEPVAVIPAPPSSSPASVHVA